MTRPRLHPDQVDTSVALARALVDGQFPQWADEPITPVGSYGTDHDLYRLGDELCVRLPVIGWATEQASSERRWLPRFAPHLTLTVPEQVAAGEPGEGYPHGWSICRWLPGRAADPARDDDEEMAGDLAGFVRSLRAIRVDGAPPRRRGARGGAHAERDAGVRASLANLSGRIDVPAALAVWEEALAAAPWDEPGVWLHGDLLPGNIVVDEGRAAGVIDWGTLNVGDPAADLLPAWHLFSGRARARYLEGLDADDDARARGRGWVIAQAAGALDYYWDTFPVMVRQMLFALDQILSP